MNDKNIAVRIPWEIWNQLDKLRAADEIKAGKRVTMSELVRDILKEEIEGQNEHRKL